MTTLRVHVGDGEVVELGHVLHRPGGTIADHLCRCGGRWIEAFLLDDTGTAILTAAAGVVLHTEPPCPPFVRLPWYDFHRYVLSGAEPVYKPIAAGAADAAKPAKPAKLHHR